MKSKKLIITIIPLLFIIGLMLNIPIKNSQAITQDLDYTFEGNIIFNETNPIVFENSDNFRNTQNFTGYFNGSYSFTNETGLFDTEISFMDTIVSGIKGNVSISSSLQGHSEILNLTVEGSGDDSGGYDNIDNPIGFGTIEFWILTTDTTYDSHFIGYQGATDGFHLRIDADKFAYYDGSNHDITEALDNTWYHIRIDFECGVSGYLGLPSDNFYITINGKQYGNYPYRNGLTNLDKFQLYIIDAQSYSTFYDAIGYSWFDNYTIEQNLLPYSIPLDDMEIADWLFTYDDNGNLYTDGADNPDSWIDIESGSDRVGIDLVGFESFYVIDQFSYGSDIGFHKDDFDIIDGLIEINITINICLIALSGSLITNVYSYDDTEIIRIKMYPDGANYKLDYFDGVAYNTLFTFDNESSFNYADFHFYIIQDLIIIEMTIDDYGINELFHFPIIVSGKKGLSEIKVMSDVLDDSRQQKIRYESIGVYINGSSIVIDYVYSIYQDFQAITKTNLNYIIFEINATGIFSIGILDVSFNYIQIINTTEYSGYNKTIMYNISDNLIWINPVRIKIIYNSSFTLNHLHFSTCYLKESTNIYPLQFNFNNVNKDQNYFYVVNDKLYFNVDLNNYSYEGISATFTIPEVSTLNGSISFTNYYSGHLIPYLCLNYTYATTDYYEFKNYPNTIKHILPQNKFLYQFIINVSDYIPFSDNNYTNHSSGFISGYIQNIKLVYIPDISITITTLDLITVIIPIMFIFIPSLMFYYGFGKEAVFPAIILMTIIALISNLIQAWIFFVIAYSVFIQLITQRKRSM